MISAVALSRRYGWRFVRPRLLAGTVGPHEIFPLAVLAGVSCTWAFILGVAAGEPLGAGGRSCE